MAVDRWPRIFPVSGENQGGGKDTLWLQLAVKELKAQTMDVRNKGGLDVGSTLATMQLLLPMDFQQTVNHIWEDTDTLATKLGEKYRTLKTGGQQILDAFTNNSGYGNIISGAASGVADVNVRPDSPTIFRSSQKREISLSFHLADQGDTEKDVFEPVNLLMYYSSSGAADEYFKIDYPYIFELQTVTGDSEPIQLINFKHAALTSVQPTYKGPYRNGYPTHCELTLQFKDLEPLFKKTFDEGPTRVTVSVLGGR